MLYNITSIAHNHHTDIYPLLNIIYIYTLTGNAVEGQGRAVHHQGLRQAEHASYGGRGPRTLPTKHLA